MQEMQPFFIRRRIEDGRVVLELGGDCDASTLEELNEALRDVVAEPTRELLVDLEQVTFIDSLTLGSLTAAAKQVRARGDSFRVVGALALEVRRAFEITGLDRYLLAQTDDVAIAEREPQGAVPQPGLSG